MPFKPKKLTCEVMQRLFEVNQGEAKMSQERCYFLSMSFYSRFTLRMRVHKF